MKNLFIGLMIKFPITISLLVLATMTGIVFYAFNWMTGYQNLDFKWFFTLAGLTVALLAQVYGKLQDTRFIANATSSELNRIGDSVNLRKKPIIKLIFFHLIFGIISFIIFSLPLSPLEKKIAFAIGLAFIVLWVISLLFGYLLLEEIAEFTATLIKRKLEKENRETELKAFTKA